MSIPPEPCESGTDRASQHGNISAAVVVNRGRSRMGAATSTSRRRSPTNRREHDRRPAELGRRRRSAHQRRLGILNSERGADFATLAISLSPSTVVTFNSDQHLKALALTSANAAMGTPNMLVLNTLTMDDNSVLDIGTGKMVVTNSADPSGNAG